MARRSACALVAASVAHLARVARATELGPAVAWSLQLSGACVEQCGLNGLIYDYQGRTGNGSPYYKGRGRKDYLYYDPDCTGGGDGTPRWILDTDKPVPGKVSDLDDDKACDYIARANTFDGSHPPLAATWKMQCGESWSDRFITFVEITSTTTTSTATETTTSTVTTMTSTRTTTTPTSTTATRTTTTATSTTATVTPTVSSTTTTQTTRTRTTTATATTTPTTTTTTSTETETTTTETETETETTTVTLTTTIETLVLSGACGFKNFLNGMRFVSQGLVASGAPFYKGTYGRRAQYIYYDLDCDGSADGPSRWIIDEDEPNTTLTEDLDEDGACSYHARLDAPLRPGRRPPSVADWTMFCGEGWQEVRIRLTPEELGSNDTEVAPDTLWVMGACPEKEYLNGLAFLKEEEVTVLGAPIYKSVDYDQYLYYDPACDGNAFAGSPRWIIDATAPNASREMDLDDDGVCDYHARTDTSDWRRPPALATWHMHCGGAWRDVILTLLDESPESETTTYPPTIVSSARGRADHLLALPSLLLALVLAREVVP